MSASKRKQPRIEMSSFTPPQRGPAASTILGINLGLEKEQSEVNLEPIQNLNEQFTEETDKIEDKKSDSVEMLISNLKKDSFVSRHQKESFYIENDLHETFFNVTNGVKSAKTQLINLALREFFESHNIEIKMFTGQYATGTRRKKKE